jgi:hypothetical protein
MSFRSILTVIALAALGFVFVGQIRELLDDPKVWPPDDFIEYWAAATLARQGQNPYDGKLLLPVEQAGGSDTTQPVMMWNPPWTLTVVLPLGFLPSRAAQLIWLAVNLSATIFSGDRLWRLFGGPANKRWIGWAIAFFSLPSLFALGAGQIGPLLLLGAVLFLECERRGYYMAAGAATVLLAIKPHLAYLVWVAILADAVLHRRGRILLGALVAGLFCSVFPLLLVPHVWSQFLDAMANRPPEQWVSPTLGTVLRLVFGAEHFRLQFVPVLVGLAWFAWYYPRWAKRWNWSDQVPLLVLVSFVTAPYGAWPFDMVLLLPAALWLIVCVDGKRGREGVRSQEKEAPVSSFLTPHSPSSRWRLSILLAAVNLGCLVCNLLQTGSFAFLWVSPTVLLLYIIGCRTLVRTPPDTVNA